MPVARTSQHPTLELERGDSNCGAGGSGVLVDGQLTANSVALESGFTLHNRFSFEYRHLFGERPIDTLRPRTSGEPMRRPAVRSRLALLHTSCKQADLEFRWHEDFSPGSLQH